MVIFKLVHIFQIFESFYRHLFVLDILYHLHFEELILYNFSFLKYIKIFMTKQIVCVCVHVYFIYTAGCGCSLAAGLGTSCGGAPDTCCTDVGGWVSRLGSCDVQWELFGTLIEGNCETSIFHFIHNWMHGYQECRSFTRILPVPQEIVKCTLLITTVQNGNLSFLDCQRLRALFHLLLITFFLLLSTHPYLKRLKSS